MAGSLLVQLVVQEADQLGLPVHVDLGQHASQEVHHDLVTSVEGHLWIQMMNKIK